MSMLTIDKGSFEAEAIAAMCRSSILVRCENSTYGRSSSRRVPAFRSTTASLPKPRSLKHTTAAAVAEEHIVRLTERPQRIRNSAARATPRARRHHAAHNRFQKPLRSEIKYSVPSRSHCGSSTDSAAPPAMSTVLSNPVASVRPP